MPIRAAGSSGMWVEGGWDRAQRHLSHWVLGLIKQEASGRIKEDWDISDLLSLPVRREAGLDFLTAIPTFLSQLSY